MTGGGFLAILKALAPLPVGLSIVELICDAVSQLLRTGRATVSRLKTGTANWPL